MASKGMQTSRQMNQRIDKVPQRKFRNREEESQQNGNGPQRRDLAYKSLKQNKKVRLKIKVIENLFNEIIAEKPTTLEKEMDIKTQRIFRSPKIQKKNLSTASYIHAKTTKQETV